MKKQVVILCQILFMGLSLQAKQMCSIIDTDLTATPNMIREMDVSAEMGELTVLKNDFKGYRVSVTYLSKDESHPIIVLDTLKYVTLATVEGNRLTYKNPETGRTEVNILCGPHRIK